MSKSSINKLFGSHLIESGYKMSTANHFEKKYENYLFCIDRDIADHFELRLLKQNQFGETKCINSEFVKGFSNFETNDFINLIQNTEEKYRKIIENQ